MAEPRQTSIFYDLPEQQPDPEPFVIVQTDCPMTEDERRAWIKGNIDEAYAKGGSFARVTQHPKNRNLYLLEIWKVGPRDQGEPRWQVPTGQAEKST
jgi:hypothetical protein